MHLLVLVILSLVVFKPFWNFPKSEIVLNSGISQESKANSAIVGTYHAHEDNETEESRKVLKRKTGHNFGTL